MDALELAERELLQELRRLDAGILSCLSSPLAPPAWIARAAAEWEEAHARLQGLRAGQRADAGSGRDPALRLLPGDRARGAA